MINKLLIVGRADVGKSTLCQHIAYRWATKDLFAERFNTVFWLKLKHLNQTHFLNQKSLTLADVVRMDWQSHQAGREVPSIKDIQSRLDDEQTLIILDGFDEVAHLYGEPNPLGGVLKAALQYKHILLTTRPYGVPQDIKFDRTLENLGFSDKQIARYVSNLAKQSNQYDKATANQQAKAFCDQLKNNANVWGIVHIPINLNLLCQLRFDDEAHLDFTQEINLTRLYTKMGELLLRHYVKEKKDVKDSTERPLHNL